MSVQELKSWALSPKNNTIALFHSETPDGKFPSQPVILIGGVHGDEPEGVELAGKTLDWLTRESSQKNSRIAVPWVLIPCLNPDGYKANRRTNGNGVDLNRNYPSRGWNSQYDQDRYYPGVSPGSEPEIQSLVKLIRDTNPRLLIHCHSWHPSIVIAGPTAQEDAQALSRSSGYAIQESIGYPTPGSLSEFGWRDQGIPVICIEEQEHIDLALVWPHFEAGIIEIFCNPSSRR